MLCNYATLLISCLFAGFRVLEQVCMQNAQTIFIIRSDLHGPKNRHVPFSADFITISGGASNASSKINDARPLHAREHSR